MTTTVIPTLYRLRKDYIVPEDETATGPNFPRIFRLTAEIAPGQTISIYRITDTLPNNIVVLNSPAFTFSPATASLSVPPYTNSANSENMLTFTPLADWKDTASATSTPPRSPTAPTAPMAQATRWPRSAPRTSPLSNRT